VATGLLLRRNYGVVTPEGELTVDVYFDDYAAVPGADGLRMARTQSSIFPDAPSQNIIFRLTDVRANVPLDPRTFVAPKQ